MTTHKVLPGYQHALYAESFAAFGTPRYLPRSGGWILERQIGDTPHRDAMGCYPLFSCADWSQLAADLEEIGEELVSLTVVPAPFENFDEDLLNQYFGHVVRFKEHFVAELTQPVDEFIKPSHRSTVRRAQRKVEVQLCQSPLDYLDRWVELFSVLVERHEITGMRAFSREAFEKQLQVPGLVMFEALVEGETVGLDLWYEQGEVAYGHLVAFSDRGYKARASYATKRHMLEYFSGKVRWVELGGGAGAKADADDGLTVYKRGWSTGTVPVYICGRIFQPDIYAELCRARQIESSPYFPAYRTGEFA